MNLKYLDYKVIDYNFGFFPLVIFNESPLELMPQIFFANNSLWFVNNT